MLPPDLPLKIAHDIGESLEIEVRASDAAACVFCACERRRCLCVLSVWKSCFECFATCSLVANRILSVLSLHPLIVLRVGLFRTRSVV